jgi:hypothetical protein
MDEKAAFSEQPTAWKIILELMTGNVIISKVDDLMYVVSNKAEDHLSYSESVGTTECMMLYPRCHKH